MEENLLNIRCEPCKEGEPPLNEERARLLYQKLGQGWYMEENHHLEKEFSFKNFQEALDFTNAIGLIAENENHHPDIFLTWGKVFVTLLTHKIDGLSINDFILAAKFDESYKNLS